LSRASHTVPGILFEFALKAGFRVFEKSAFLFEKTEELKIKEISLFRRKK